MLGVHPCASSQSAAYPRAGCPASPVNSNRLLTTSTWQMTLLLLRGLVTPLSVSRSAGLYPSPCSNLAPAVIAFTA